MFLNKHSGDLAMLKSMKLIAFFILSFLYTSHLAYASSCGISGPWDQPDITVTRTGTVSGTDTVDNIRESDFRYFRFLSGHGGSNRYTVTADGNGNNKLRLWIYQHYSCKQWLWGEYVDSTCTRTLVDRKIRAGDTVTGIFNMVQNSSGALHYSLSRKIGTRRIDWTLRIENDC